MAKATAAQVKEFLEGVLQCVVDRDHLQRHIESGKVFELLGTDPDQIDEAAFRAALDPAMGREDREFLIKVDFSIPLDRMIARARFAMVSDHATTKNFPNSDPGFTGIRNCRMRLFRFRKPMTEDQMRGKFVQGRMRPAKIEELLAFGTRFPDFQRKFPIVAIGSSWTDDDGLVSVPALGMAYAGRSLDLCWTDPSDQWDPLYRMLVICE